MKISNNGIDFLKRQEGEKLSAYKDTRGSPRLASVILVWLMASLLQWA